MSWFRIAVVALGVLVLSTSAWAGETGKWLGKAVLTSVYFKSLAVADKDGHKIMMGEDAGLVFNENGEAFLDKAEYRVQWIVDTGGMVKGGYKTFTDTSGKVFAKFTIGEFTDTGPIGTWEFVGGTGKYEGITGLGDFKVTNVSDAVYWDLLEGEYKLP